MTSHAQPGRTKADLVYEALREAILSGSIRPGERLRQEDVARRWEVSPTPVREAFRRLESDGLVEYEANRGVVVRSAPDADEHVGIEALARHWQELLRRPDSIPGSDFP